MSDRHHPMYPSNIYPPSQWGAANSDHPAPSGSFPSPPASYASSPHSPTRGARPQTAFVAQTQYPSAYQQSSPSYAASPSSAPPHQTTYSMSPPFSPPSRSNSYGHSHSHSHPSLTQMQTNTRPRSHSQTHTYFSGQPPNNPMSPPPMPSTRYSPPVPYAHTINIPTQYPASPSRPFSCDMCPLSFNRQHDLSRHRQTHTGEKPFTCNGGCGKSFTRRDALKRHQLVKGCGKIEEAWP